MSGRLRGGSDEYPISPSGVREEPDLGERGWQVELYVGIESGMREEPAGTESGVREKLPTEGVVKLSVDELLANYRSSNDELERLFRLGIERGYELETIEVAVRIIQRCVALSTTQFSDHFIGFCLSLAGHITTNPTNGLALCTWPGFRRENRNLYWTIALNVTINLKDRHSWLTPFHCIFDNWDFTVRQGLYFHPNFYNITRVLLAAPLSVQQADRRVILIALSLLYRRRRIRGQRLTETYLFYRRLRVLAWRVGVSVSELVQRLHMIRDK